MDAKMLRDEIATKPGAYVVSHPEHQSTILRALDLLAAVEGSQDEIVRELREKRDTFDGYGGNGGMILHRAAAALVAMKAAKEKAEADLDRALEACKDHLYRMSEVEAERDEIKRHAEAMAKILRALNNRGGLGLDVHKAIDSVIDAYHAAQEKP